MSKSANSVGRANALVRWWSRVQILAQDKFFFDCEVPERAVQLLLLAVWLYFRWTSQFYLRTLTELVQSRTDELRVMRELATLI